jgi:hypothetical protein
VMAAASARLRIPLLLSVGRHEETLGQPSKGPSASRAKVRLCR